MTDGWPEQLAIDAFTGEGPASSAPGDRFWGLGPDIRRERKLLAPEEPPDLRNWRDPRVGWGLVLHENPDLPVGERARCDDAPEPIRRLVEARGHDGRPAPVYRYLPDLPDRFSKLRDYRHGLDVMIDSPMGLGKGRLPFYLLIYGGPGAVGWHLQFTASTFRCVGRLDLEGDALERYVDALLAGWPGSGRRLARPVVWAVDDGTTAITRLMRDVVAKPIADALADDAEIEAVELVDGALVEASSERLLAALAAARPALVVTTGHGKTAPLDDPAALGADLGLPVGAAGGDDVVQPEALLDAWQPDGAIWVCQACCSAGADAHSRYLDLVQPHTVVHRVLSAVERSGSRVAPLPRALLGAEKPLAAFVGHVEPTFSWTLSHPRTGQLIGAALTESVYERLHRAKPEPIGLALRRWHQRSGPLFSAHAAALAAFNRGEPTEAELAVNRLAAQDVESLVVLGDPTVVVRPA